MIIFIFEAPPPNFSIAFYKTLYLGLSLFNAPPIREKLKLSEKKSESYSEMATDNIKWPLKFLPSLSQRVVATDADLNDYWQAIEATDRQTDLQPEILRFFYAH